VSLTACVCDSAADGVCDSVTYCLCVWQCCWRCVWQCYLLPVCVTVLLTVCVTVSLTACVCDSAADGVCDSVTYCLRVWQCCWWCVWQCYLLPVCVTVLLTVCVRVLLAQRTWLVALSHAQTLLTLYPATLQHFLVYSFHGSCLPLVLSPITGLTVTETQAPTLLIQSNAPQCHTISYPAHRIRPQKSESIRSRTVVITHYVRRG